MGNQQNLSPRVAERVFEAVFLSISCTPEMEGNSRQLLVSKGCHKNIV